MFRDKTHKKCYPPRGRPHGAGHRRHPGMYRPMMSMSKESFREMRSYFVLKILTDNVEGITGYQLQEDYHFPRTNVLRVLDRMVEDKLVESKEEVVDGRANKLYLITEKGTKYMEELKEKWGERFRMMSDTTMPFFNRGEKFHFMKRVHTFKTSEDAIDYFRGVRSKIKSRQISLKDRMKVLDDRKNILDKIIETVEKDKDFDKEKLIKLVEELWEKQNKDKTETE